MAEKKMPRYLIAKIERANRLMEEIISINIELEEWLEKRGIYDGFDFTFDYRESRGYEITQVEQFVRRVEEEINK